MRIADVVSSARRRPAIMVAAAPVIAALAMAVHFGADRPAAPAAGREPGCPATRQAAHEPRPPEILAASTQSASDLPAQEAAAAPEPGARPANTGRRRPLMWRPGLSPGTLVSVADRWRIKDLFADKNRQYFPAVRAVTISEYWISTRSFRLLDELPNLKEVTVRVGGRGRLPWWSADDEKALPPRVRVTAAQIAHLSSKPLATIIFDGLILDKEGIAELSECTTLRLLAICDCDLSGATLAPLTALVGLERLSLSGVALPAPSVDLIAAFPRIKRLDLTETGLRPADVAKLRAAMPRAAITADGDVDY